MTVSAPASAPSGQPVAASATHGSIGLALLAFHRHVGPIYKASQAKYGAFANLQTVLEAVTPPLLDQGLVLTQTLHPAADGASLLRTRLLHADTDEAISSEWLIPSLDALLVRSHELRQAVIERFPIDLALAAAGAVPFSLPPRPPAPAADHPPLTDPVPAASNGAKPSLPAPSAPERPLGLRLDDQLKGLYTLLGQLGTTTNPLHSLGGVVTYLRRYQILSLLCLSAEDNDGDESSHREPAAQHHSSTAAPTGIAAQASAAGAQPTAPTRRRRSSKPSLPAPSEPTAVQDPQPAPAPAAASQPPEQPHRLSSTEVQELIGEIRTLPAEVIPQIVSDFRSRFELPSTALVSDYIQTADHAAFLRDRIAQRRQPAAI